MGTLTNQDVETDSTILYMVQGVAVSPDGKNVYVTSGWTTGGSITHWDCDTATGALSNQVSKTDNTNFQGATGVMVSPDGKFVYSTWWYSNSIVYWDRDTTTGVLSNQVNLRDNTNLDGALYVTLSPDGKNVYVVGAECDSIVY